jgi:hypothetical protein
MQKRRGLPRLFHIRPLLYPATFEPGAGDGVRTRDPKLGKLVLYQLSYSRQMSVDMKYILVVHPIDCFYYILSRLN